MRNPVLLYVALVFLGGSVAALVSAARSKPPLSDCIALCKGANAMPLYAHDGACACIPACPVCPSCEPKSTAEKPEDEEQ